MIIGQKNLKLDQESPYAAERERQLLLNGANALKDRLARQAVGVSRLADCSHGSGVCTGVLFLPRSGGLFVSSGASGVRLWTTTRIPAVRSLTS